MYFSVYKIRVGFSKLYKKTRLDFGSEFTT